MVQVGAVFPYGQQLAELLFYEEFQTDAFGLDVTDRRFFVYAAHFPRVVREIDATVLDECDRSEPDCHENDFFFFFGETHVVDQIALPTHISLKYSNKIIKIFINLIFFI
ncbi:MAG: hypothetical protein ACK56F_16995 [bacterium]